jgi:hypothetical protein
MASEYPIDIRTWLEELRAIERLGGDHEADDSSTTNTM